MLAMPSTVMCERESQYSQALVIASPTRPTDQKIRRCHNSSSKSSENFLPLVPYCEARPDLVLCTKEWSASQKMLNFAKCHDNGLNAAGKSIGPLSPVANAECIASLVNG